MKKLKIMSFDPDQDLISSLFHHFQAYSKFQIFLNVHLFETLNSFAKNYFFFKSAKFNTNYLF